MVMGQPRREVLALLPDKTWAHSSVHKAKLLTPIAVKQSEVFIAGHQARKPRQLMFETPKLPSGFQESILKGNMRERGAP